MTRGNWTDGESFYVDAVDGKRVALLAGPFRTLSEAEALVDRARALAVDVDPRAWFYAFGCSKWANGHREGRLNKELGL